MRREHWASGIKQYELTIYRDKQGPLAIRCRRFVFALEVTFNMDLRQISPWPEMKEILWRVRKGGSCAHLPEFRHYRRQLKRERTKAVTKAVA